MDWIPIAIIVALVICAVIVSFYTCTILVNNIVTTIFIIIFNLLLPIMIWSLLGYPKFQITTANIIYIALFAGIIGYFIYFQCYAIYIINYTKC